MFDNEKDYYEQNEETFKEYQITNVASPIKPGIFVISCIGSLIVIFTIAIGGTILLFVNENLIIVAFVIAFIEIGLFMGKHENNLEKWRESINKVVEYNKKFEDRLNINTNPNLFIEGGTTLNYQLSYTYINEKIQKLYIATYCWNNATSSYNVKETILNFSEIIDYKINYITETEHTATGISFDNPLSESSQIGIGSIQGSSTQIPTNIVINTKNINYSSINIMCANSDELTINKFDGWLKIIINTNKNN